MKKIFRIWVLIGIFLLSGYARAAEYFYLTHYEAAYTVEDQSPPPVDDPQYGDTIIYIDGDQIGLVDADCTGKITEIIPFSQRRAFIEIVDDAGGDKAFRKFLKKKIHTDMDQWKKEYRTKLPLVEFKTSACQLLQRGLIIRSPNEIIITDTQYFYRFLLGRTPIGLKDEVKQK